MTTYTHQTAPTQFVEANGIRFAYRRFGKATGVPIVFNQHYTGTMDHWDPAVTDGFAREREVIRFRLRAKDRDPEVNEQVAPAQRAAIAKWAAPRERPYDYLKAIQQPTLVVNGSNDVIIYTMNSFILQQNLPNAQLIIYPDSAHGSHHQYPELFVRHASMFLSGAEGRESLSVENGRPFATSGNREHDHAQPRR
jgi:pimeloyl-ACP methyl ester carboxylesterase